MRKKAETIAPGVYPVLPRAGAKALQTKLHDPAMAGTASAVLASFEERLRGDVLSAIARLETARHDPAQLYQEAHEIRGLAGNAGLGAAAKIAGLLCRYLDAATRAGATLDTTLIALHIHACARAAHAKDDTERLGDAVISELAGLVSRALAEIYGPSPRL